MRLIDADEVKKSAKRIESFPWGDEKGNRVEFAWTPKELERLIDKSPTIEAKPVVHGEWIKIDKHGKNVQCSKCGNTLDLRGVNAGRGDANYCPNCGAKMGSNDAIPFNARWEIDEREFGGYDS